jgi:hypothetical protein
MCLWQGPSIKSSVSDDCTFLFHEYISDHKNNKDNNATNIKDDVKKSFNSDNNKNNNNNNNNNKELLAVMTMSNLLVSELHIPNEYLLMKKWKEASIFATKFPHKAEIGVNIKSI